MDDDDDTELEGVHARLRIRRPVAGVVVLELTGRDIGELGGRPFAELDRDLARADAIALFVDARAARGVALDVSGAWATWLARNQDQIRQLDMLVASTFVELTAQAVRRFSTLASRMRIFHDPAAFDAALADALGPAASPLN